MNNQSKKQITIVPKNQRNKNNTLKKKKARKTRKNNKITSTLEQALQQKAKNPIYKNNSGVQHFSRVYMDPFTELGARIPVFPVEATQLVTCRARGNGSTNGVGRGWIAVQICNGVTSDRDAVYVSSTTSPDYPNLTASGVIASQTNSPYVSSQFVSDLNGSIITEYMMRPVAAGVRWRYVGTNLNMSGVAHCCQNSPRNVDPTGITPNDMFAIPSKEYMFDRKWRAVTRHITSHEDFLFQSIDQDTSFWCYERDQNERSLDNHANLLVDIFCLENSPFEWEAYFHYEIRGKNLQRIGTSSPNRPGVEQVLYNATAKRLVNKTLPDHNVPTGEKIAKGVFSEIGGELIGGLASMFL